MTTRDARGRWLPGRSANPKGRPPGSGKIAKFRQALIAEVPEIIAALGKEAKAGDAQAAKLLLERVLPPLRDLPVDVDVDGNQRGFAVATCLSRS